MDIKTTIKDNRKKLAMTQEQIADYLGVTASAVYKWEKGSAYPDITLLPALARVLKLDMNSLLSFHENLSDREIQLKSKEFLNIAQTQGLQAASRYAQEQVKEYPRCDNLIYTMAMYMKSGLEWYPSDRSEQETEQYEDQIIELFLRVGKSEAEAIRDSAQYMIFYHYLNQKKDYEMAGNVLAEYQGDKGLKEQMQISLYRSQDKMEEARRMLENKLLKAAGEVQTTLSQLQQIYLKENDLETARFLADTTSQAAKTLGLWEFGRYSPYLDLYVTQKDTANVISAFRSMMEHIEKLWEPRQSPLYRHIPVKEHEDTIQKQMKTMIVSQLLKDENLKFLEESQEGREFLKQLEGVDLGTSASCSAALGETFEQTVM